MNSNDNDVSVLHPLQRLLFLFTKQIGFLIAFFIIGFWLISLYLITTSAFAINQILGVITTIGVIVMFIAVSYFVSEISKHNFEVHIGKSVTKLTWHDPMYIVAIIAGFIQTIFWMIDHDNTMHEPRSVFILAVAAFIGYLKVQMYKMEQSTSMEVEAK